MMCKWRTWNHDFVFIHIPFSVSYPVFGCVGCDKALCTCLWIGTAVFISQVTLSNWALVRWFLTPFLAIWDWFYFTGVTEILCAASHNWESRDSKDTPRLHQEYIYGLQVLWPTQYFGVNQVWLKNFLHTWVGLSSGCLLPTIAKGTGESSTQADPPSTHLSLPKGSRHRTDLWC